MISKEKATRFGYQEITPYTELLHAIGLLHTSRKIDNTFALSQVKRIMHQKFDSFCIAVVYDSSKKGNDVCLSKVYKAGRRGFTEKIKKSMPISNIEFDSDINATTIEASGTKKGLFFLKQNILFNAMSSQFKLILLYDVTRNIYEMYNKSLKRE